MIITGRRTVLPLFQSDVIVLIDSSNQWAAPLSFELPVNAPFSHYTARSAWVDS